MKTVAFLIASLLAGCASRPESTTIVSATVASYREMITLDAPEGVRTYVAELVITAPEHLDGRLLSVSSTTPLPAGHPLQEVGAALTLSVASLESGRGTSRVPAEGAARIIYNVRIQQVRAVGR